jgi:hypothetical protein
MDHSDVVRLQAVEKYVLGELSAELRDQFEEHYFDCSECAQDVKTLATFMTASRAILAERERSTAAELGKGPERGDWFAWLRPAIALPAMAALALVIVFQNVVTIPALKQHQGTSEAGVFATSYRLQGATRGDTASRVAIAPEQSFALDFDFTPAVPYQSYIGKLVDKSGGTVVSFAVGGEMANREVHLVIPGGKVRAGEYQLIFLGRSNLPSKDEQSREVQRISFVVENRP